MYYISVDPDGDVDRFTALSTLEIAVKHVDDQLGKMDRAFKDLTRHTRCEVNNYLSFFIPYAL